MAEITHASTENPAGSKPPNPRWKLKLSVLIVVVALFVMAILRFGEDLSLNALAEKEASFRDFRTAHPVLVYVVAFFGYVAVTGLSLPGATAMTLILAWLLGFWPGLVIVSFASTTGATIAFTISRYLLRDSIQNRLGHRLATFNDALRREGAFYLFTLRLIPVVPFFVINLVMGLTPIRTSTFWWVSQAGMLPGTLVYVYAGASVPSLQHLADKGAGGILSLQLVIAFILLGLFPFAVRKIMNTIRSRSAPSA